MPEHQSKPKRKLKKGLKTPETVRLRLTIRKLEKRIKELEEQLSGGWVSDDGVWCDIIYAARYVNKNVQTLRNLRSEGKGPVSFGRGSGVKYKVALLDAYNETGYSQRDYDQDNQK